jgi:hypothetical protein
MNKEFEDDNISVYNDKEIEYLDKFLPNVEHFVDVKIGLTTGR